MMTPAQVAARFDEAARILKSLPPDRPREYGSMMPEPLRDAADEFAKAVRAGCYELPEVQREGLTRDDLRRLGEVLDWFFFFPSHALWEWRAIWAIAFHAPVKSVSRRLGCSRGHVYWLRERGLARLADALGEA